ncbi:PCNA-associated factor, partial [Paramuricea clavata]
VGAKAPRKQLGAGGSNLGSSGSNDKHSGGNPVRWTPTPTWQKGIGNFFQKGDASNGENSCEPNNDTTSSTESSTPSSEVISLEPNNDTTPSTQSSETGSEPSSEIISLED